MEDVVEVTPESFVLDSLMAPDSVTTPELQELMLDSEMALGSLTSEV
jgi:hypothetical protein